MEMLPKALKILTVLSYCFIQLNGEHLGGPLILFLFLGLFNGSWITVLGIISILTALTILCLTIWREIFIPDKIVIPIVLIILFVPLTLETVEVIENGRWLSTRFFQYTVGLFITLAGWLAILTLKQKKHSH